MLINNRDFSLGLLSVLLAGGINPDQPTPSDDCDCARCQLRRKVEALRTQRGPDQTGVKVDKDGVKVDPAPVYGSAAAAAPAPTPIPPAEPARVPAIQHAYALVGSIAREGMEGANFTIEFNGKRYFVSANVESP